MPLFSHVDSHANRAFRALSVVLALAAALIAAGCSASPHEDVYSLASERARIVAPALIAPGAGSEYAFTVESVPTIRIDCAIAGATAWVSLDGGDYRRYEGPFALSVADPKVDQTITLTAYTAHDDYRPSEPVTQVYRFVATTVPAPAVSPSAAGTDYPFTIESVPSIALACSLSGATTWYSVDGGEYRAYEGPFALSVADPKVEQTISVSAYSTHPDYRPSPTVTQVYRFSPTTVPSPVISATQEPTSYHFYYHYDKIPTISAACSLASATIWYSRDGGATYEKYSGPFALPVNASPGSIESYTLSMYATAEGYIDSPVSSESYRFAKNGTIVTIAGTGEAGYTGDGEKAGQARLRIPESVCVAKDGTMYIADTGNKCIRMIDPDGTISTIAGPGSNDYLYDSGPALDAHFGNPLSLALDREKGILYVADTSPFRVMAITLTDGNTRFFTGAARGTLNDDGTPRLNGAIAPRAIWFIPGSPSGTLFIMSDNGQMAWEVDADIEKTGSSLHLVAGGGTLGVTDGMSAVDALFKSPSGVCADGTNVYIADYPDSVIYRVERSSQKLYTVCDLAPFGVWQVFVENSVLYFSQNSANRIMRYYEGGLTNMAGSSSGVGITSPTTDVDGAMPGEPSLTTPKGLFVVPGDGIFVADCGNNRIRKVILY